MVKFTAQGLTGPLIGLGVTKENIKRLREGQPIIVHLTDLHLPPGEIMIFYGDTEQAITKAMLPFINEQTIVHGTETLPLATKKG